MEYLINRDFRVDSELIVTANNILASVNQVNEFFLSLPPSLYNNIDFKTTGAIIGAAFCAYIVGNIKNAIVNPIEKGHPDIIPVSALNSTERQLRNYPHGLEIKSTIGNVTTGANLRAGISRINSITGITWQAHHGEVNNLLGIVWDFANEHNSFNYPAITAAYFSDNLEIDDWGKISGTTGRNTKVCGMKKSGKVKMGRGWVLIYDNLAYITKYRRFLSNSNLD